MIHRHLSSYKTHYYKDALIQNLRQFKHLNNIIDLTLIYTYAISLYFKLQPLVCISYALDLIYLVRHPYFILFILTFKILISINLLI